VRSLGPKRSRKTNVFPPLVLVLKIAPDGSLGCTSHLSREFNYKDNCTIDLCSMS